MYSFFSIDLLLHFYVTQKALQLSFLQFFAFFFWSVFRQLTGESLFANVSLFVTQDACDQGYVHVTGRTGKYFCQCSVYLKFIRSVFYPKLVKLPGPYLVCCQCEVYFSLLIVHLFDCNPSKQFKPLSGWTFLGLHTIEGTKRQNFHICLATVGFMLLCKCFI